MIVISKSNKSDNIAAQQALRLKRGHAIVPKINYDAEAGADPELDIGGHNPELDSGGAIIVFSCKKSLNTIVCYRKHCRLGV